MAEETLWNGVVLSQPDSIFPLGTDAVACAGFARPPRGARVTVRILGINHETNRIWGVITHVSMPH